MKKIKKLITLCLVFALVCTSALAYDMGTLNYLGVVPDGVTDTATVTREILAYSLAGTILPNTECEPTDTAFSDVKADNKYSGYIKAVSDRGIMNGSGDGLFNPQRTVGINEVSKTFVTLLGYEAAAQAKGGWPGGYLAVASALKLYRGVDTGKAELTYGDIKLMMLNLLECPVPEESIYTEDGQPGVSISKKSGGPTYANKALDLYEYDGVVTDIDYEKYKATVTFSQQESDNSKYNNGDVKTFDVNADLNIAYYKNLPAKLVIYDDKLIVDASLEDGINISYGVVESVNNETIDTSYNVNHINSITLSNDENYYTFEDDCTFLVNGNKVSGKLSLIGKYVKIAYKDEKIVSLSYYELKDGGRITSVSRENIDYAIGASPRRLDKVMEAEELVVIIDGESRGYKELKAGMLFSYWRSDDKKTLVIMTSGKQLTDVLHGIDTSGKTLSLGKNDIEYTDDIYSSGDNKAFVKGYEALLDYSGVDVIVSLDIYNRARYVVSYENKDSSNRYYGYILGYNEATSFRGAEVRMICVSEDGTPTKDLALSKNVTFNDSSDISTVVKSAGANDGSALFEVKFNGKGEITQFTSPTELEGFEGRTWSSSSFTTSWLPVAGRKLPIANTTPVICIGGSGDDIEAYKLTFASIGGKIFEDAYSTGGRIYCRFFSYDQGQTLGMVLMTGDINIVPNVSKTGIVDRVGKIRNSNGDTVDSITIDGATYVLAEDNKVKAEAGNLVSFSESLFKSGEVTISKALDLKKDFSLWDGVGYGDKRTFRTGTVVKADKNKIVISLNSAYSPSSSVNLEAGDEYLCYYESGCKFYGIDSEGELSTLSYQDIVPDMKIALLIYRNASWAVDSVDQVYVRVD